MNGLRPRVLCIEAFGAFKIPNLLVIVFFNVREFGEGR